MRHKVSIVVPVYNEADAIKPFMEAIERAVASLEIDFDVIFVDDGSRDETCARIEAIAPAYGVPVQLVALSRNFGKEAALTAGIDAATGDAVILIDVDLQHPPELIPEFIERWQAGYKMVYARRSDRAHETWLKRTTANGFYRLFNRMSQTDIPSNTGDFCLIDRAAIEALSDYRERTRFMKGLLSTVGFKVTHIDYKQPERQIGKSKWNYWKLWNFALDGIFSFSTVPLRVWTYIGAVIAGASFIYALVIIFTTLFRGADAPGYASLVTIILFMGGIQLISLGIIGEYISRIFLETKQRPIYTIDHSRSFHQAEKTP